VGGSVCGTHWRASLHAQMGDARLDRVTDFVLVHGTTQSPTGWDRLVAALDARGHRSQTVDLARSDELSAEDYADEVRRQVPKTAAHPVVVAHSGAGLLLPAAARSLGAQRQVWLAASIPDGQRSLLEIVSAAPTDVVKRRVAGQRPDQRSGARHLLPPPRLRPGHAAVGAHHPAVVPPAAGLPRAGGPGT